jgi:hypothetical protein
MDGFFQPLTIDPYKDLILRREFEELSESAKKIFFLIWHHIWVYGVTPSPYKMKTVNNILTAEPFST